jgi:hypothetical protein
VVFSPVCADVDVFYYVGKADSMSVMGSFGSSDLLCCLRRTACEEWIIRIEEHMADGCLV